MKNAAVIGGIWGMQLLALLDALAFLVCNTAAGLAGRLAGGLALAATAVFGTLAQIARLNRFDMLHYFHLLCRNLRHNFNTVCI